MERANSRITGMTRSVDSDQVLLRPSMAKHRWRLAPLAMAAGGMLVDGCYQEPKPYADPAPGLCAASHGGCHPLQSCTDLQDGGVACGPCPTGYHVDEDAGASACAPHFPSIDVPYGTVLVPAYNTAVTDYTVWTGLLMESVEIMPKLASPEEKLEGPTSVRISGATDIESTLTLVGDYQTRTDYTFRFSPGEPHAVLSPPSEVEVDRFGSGLATYAGELVVGGYTAETQMEAPVLFFQQLAGWQERGTSVVEPTVKEGSPPEASRGYGKVVAIDGQWMAVSAADSDTVHLYSRERDQWSFSQALTLPIDYEALAPSVKFGDSVALSGERLVVAAPPTATPDDDGKAGAAFAYRRTAEGWVLAHVWEAQDPEYWFAPAAAMHEDFVVITASYSIAEPPRGQMYVYDFSDPGAAPLTRDIPGYAGVFGFGLHKTVVVSPDWVVVGAHHASLADDADELYAGAVLTFRRSGKAALAAEPQVLQPPELRTVDEFGSAVDLMGPWLAVGVPGANDASGAFYLYHFMNNEWRLHLRRASPNPDQALFGTSLAFGPDYLAVGAPETEAGSEVTRGSVYLFRSY